jgi:hypothetical protein
MYRGADPVSLSPSSIYRRLRFGRPIVVVSGLPRSGTSMMMAMLQAGGMAVVTDAVRQADDSNPSGYFEHQRVLSLDKSGDHAWLRGTRGKAVKVVSALLPYLPETNRYRVIFMQRDLREVVRSQNAMLGAPGDEGMPEAFEEHLRRIKNLLNRRRCFEVLEVTYAGVVREPLTEARRVNAFLGGGLDEARMAATVNPALHRTRA